MKFKISKTDHEALGEDNQKLYKADGEDFVLSVEGMPKQEDVSGLKNKNAELLEKIAKLSDGQKEKTDAAVEAALAEAKGSGDIEALEKSWQKKYDTKVNALEATNTELNGVVAKLTSGSEATKLASAIGIKGSVEVLLPHIEKRLKTEMKDGVPVTIVLGTDGKPSALTIAELSEEFKTNEAYAPLITGSNGSGGGHNQQNRKAPDQNTDTSTMSAQEKLTHAREHPQQKQA